MADPRHALALAEELGEETGRKVAARQLKAAEVRCPYGEATSRAAWKRGYERGAGRPFKEPED